jgi:hypothetical protein
MKKLMLRFDNTGGYDSMTGAWVIVRVVDGEEQTLLTIDLSDFGQKSCDYDYRSEEAEKLAHDVYNLLSASGLY